MTPVPVTALGILVEAIGLIVAAVFLAKAWREVSDGYSLWTGKRKGPIVGSGTASGRGRLHGYGRAQNPDETLEEAVVAIRAELDGVYRRLDAEADAREDGDAALSSEIAHVRNTEDARERSATRADTRSALLGAFVAIGGILIQLAGALLGL